MILLCKGLSYATKLQLCTNKLLNSLFMEISLDIEKIVFVPNL